MPASELSSLNDQQLLKRYVDSGCEDAFSELVGRHAPLVFSVCRRHLPEQDAEDAFQATFLILVRKAAAVRWRKSVGPWLYAVATRVSANARRATMRRRDTDLASVAEPADQSLVEIEQREHCEQLDRALSRLSPRYRDPLILFYLQGKSRSEIAELLNVSLGTIKTRLQRGRSKLRLLLALRGIALGTAAAFHETAAAAVPESLITATYNVVGPSPKASSVTQLAEQELHAMAKSSLAAKGALAVATSALLVGVTASGLSTDTATAQKQNVVDLAAVQSDSATQDDRFSVGDIPSDSATQEASGVDEAPNDRNDSANARQAPVSFSASEERILTSLNDETTFNYLEMPLRDVLDDVAQRHDIPLLIHDRALEHYGIGTDTPITLNLDGVSLKSALRLMLNDVAGDLTYVLQDEVVLITTREEAETLKQIHVYDVEHSEDTQELVNLLEQVFDEESTHIAVLGERIVAKAPFRVHQKLIELLPILAN